MYLKIKGFPYLNGEMRYKNRIPVDESIGTREKKNSKWHVNSFAQGSCLHFVSA